MESLPFYLALNRIHKIGPRLFFKLRNQWPDLNELFQLSYNKLVHSGLNPGIARAISSFDFKKIEEDYKWLEHESHHILTWDSEQYPSLLREIYDPPFLLYAKGQLSCLNHPSISIVGTRNPSISGSENAYFFSKILAGRNINIVSGLALGIDAQAHKGCLAAKGSTIAVLATGMDCIYPKRHSTLARQIIEKGLILSEFPLKIPPIARHFPRRNRIISGLTSSTLVIEAACKSGSLITARYAMEQNRDVLAIPGSIHNPQSQGCHYLIQQGARLVTTVNDVLDEMNLEGTNIEKKINDSTLASGYEKLVKCIGFETTSVDQIIMRSGMDVSEVSCALTDLEVQGIIKAVPGGYTRY